jgi:hypothetical protein
MVDSSHKKREKERSRVQNHSQSSMIGKSDKVVWFRRIRESYLVSSIRLTGSARILPVLSQPKCPGKIHFRHSPSTILETTSLDIEFGFVRAPCAGYYAESMHMWIVKCTLTTRFQLSHLPPQVTPSQINHRPANHLNKGLRQCVCIEQNM